MSSQISHHYGVNNLQQISGARIIPSHALSQLTRDRVAALRENYGLTSKFLVLLRHPVVPTILSIVIHILRGNPPGFFNGITKTRIRQEIIEELIAPIGQTTTSPTEPRNPNQRMHQPLLSPSRTSVAPPVVSTVVVLPTVFLRTTTATARHAFQPAYKALPCK